MKANEIKFLLLIILITSFLIRLPALFKPPLENDEIIFKTLIEKTTFKLQDYSLQGTEILSKLPKSTYDFPVFHHPPLFVFTQAFITKVFHINNLKILPILSGLLTIFLIFKIGSIMYNQKIGLMAALILALCPITLFTSTKVWIDSYLTLLVSLTIYLFLKSEKNIIFTFLSGLTFTAAVLTKYTSVVTFPIILIILLQDQIKLKDKLKRLVVFLTPLVLTLPWFYFYYKKVGGFSKSISIKEEGENMFSFVKMVNSRPFYFYLTQTIVLAPLYILPMINFFKNGFIKRNLTIWVWAFSFLLLLTVYGLSGRGFVMRFILPLFPALSLLTAKSLDKISNKYILIILCTGILGVLTGIFNSYIFQVADLVPVFRIFV